MILPEVGGAGQARLRQARVAVVGAGGLGSPAALYLAAAGVGTLGLVDSDRVELSNLGRQILHGTKALDLPKVTSAQGRLEELNPDVRVVSHALRLDATNAREVLEPYDVVVEGSDNLPTKLAVNHACVELGRPLVVAGILRWEGQLLVVRPGRRVLPVHLPPGSRRVRCRLARRGSSGRWRASSAAWTVRAPICLGLRGAARGVSCCTMTGGGAQGDLCDRTGVKPAGPAVEGRAQDDFKRVRASRSR
jgi:molybdopterin/thiamine biosynthesis adenylyltransferase